jgi:putative flippase GtrA
METMAHRARYAAAMTAITRRLPFGLSEVVEPNMLGYLLINLCTFCIDLGLLGLLHGKERLPIPVAVTISYGTASLLSYTLNRVFNFRSHAEVGRQLPVFVAVSASNYLIFVLGFTDLLATVGVYYELARIIAACCEGVYLYCMMRWVVFRDVATSDAGQTEPGSAGDAVREPSAASGNSGHPLREPSAASGNSGHPHREPAAESATGSAAETGTASSASSASSGGTGSASPEPEPMPPGRASRRW